MGTPKILNLGCGNKPIKGAVNLDVTSRVNPDVVWDLNQRPWPFPDEIFSEVRASDVIEHLRDVVGTMEEIHRVLQPGGTVHISLPHFSSANSYTDPTHLHHFSWYSFDYFTGEHEFSFYSDKRFRTRSRQLIFHPTVVNKFVWRMANRYPSSYERRWAWMFPAWFLSVELEVVK